jgi:predicted dehydrogenase
LAVAPAALRVAVVGCGLVGRRRAQWAASHPASRLHRVIDTHRDAAVSLALRWGAVASADWQEAVDDPAVDAVIVSTPNALLAPIAIAALESGKHVLIEKPMGCDLAQAQRIAQAAQNAPGLLKVGFNHRYHPALARARRLCTAGDIGEPINARVRYGHGGRPGYEREWRGDPALAGGGELTDQGVHVADLLTWFLGPPREAFAYLQTAVWPIAPLEDNAFGLLRYESGCIASLHTSWTQWKNLFSFELFASGGSLSVEGLGGSYGPETLVVAKRAAVAGSPQSSAERFDEPDRSWELEWDDFVRAIRDGTPYWGTPGEGLWAMRILDALYESARTGKPATFSRM